jgi:hypothetical protein
MKTLTKLPVSLIFALPVMYFVIGTVSNQEFKSSRFPSTVDKSTQHKCQVLLSLFPPWNHWFQKFELQQLFSHTAVHEIAVMSEIAHARKKLTPVMSHGYLRVASAKWNTDLIKKLKINSVKWKFTLDYDITRGKQDPHESRWREKYP